jgi:hypothetical protein
MNDNKEEKEPLHRKRKKGHCVREDTHLAETKNTALKTSRVQGLWKKVQPGTLERVLERCAFLEEWLEWMCMDGMMPEIVGWKDRLLIVISRSEGHIDDLIEQLKCEVSFKHLTVWVPSQFAWGIATDREELITEQDIKELLAHEVKQGEALRIIGCLRHAGGYTKLVMLKSGYDLYWWHDAANEVWEATIDNWIEDSFKGSDPDDIVRVQIIGAWMEQKQDEHMDEAITDTGLGNAAI